MRVTKKPAVWCAAGLAATLLSGIAIVGERVSASPAASSESSFVPINPCRLFDFRPGAGQVGPRSTPLGDKEIHKLQVTGANGLCDLPSDAVAVAMNVTAVNASSHSYLQLWPADAGRPKYGSSLNYVPGQVATPNKVDVKLSADGAIKMFNLNGTIDVLGDVLGYYTANGMNEMRSGMARKVDRDDVYSKREVDGMVDDLPAFANVYDIDETFNRGEIVNKIAAAAAGKADKSAVIAIDEAIDVIDAALVGKADSSTVATLQATLTALESAVADKPDASTVAALQAAIAELEDTVADKANTSTVEALQATVEALQAALAALDSTVAGKADTSTVEALQASVNGKADTSSLEAIEATIEALEGTVAGKANTSTVEALQTTVSGKADTSSLEAIEATIEALQAALTALDGTVAGKANTTTVEALQTTVNGKANTSTVEALQTTVNGKANTTTVEALQTTVNGKANTSTVEALQTTVNGKANTTTVEALQTTVNGKADATSVYDKDEAEDYFMGRDPDVAMRQSTGDIRSLTGGLLPLSLVGVTVDATLDGLVGLVGPAALDDALHGRMDYRLDVFDFCIDTLVTGTILKTATVEVRDKFGVFAGSAHLTDLSVAGCYSVDVSAVAAGYAYYVTFDVLGDPVPGTGSLRITSMQSTWVPVVAPSAPPTPPT